MTTTDRKTGAVLLRQLRESRGWSWSDLARALRNTARQLTVTSLMHRQVTSIQRTVGRWESLTDRTGPGDRYQFLLAHLYAHAPSGALALGPGSDFGTFLDALRHFGTPPQRIRQLVELVTQSSTIDDPHGGFNADRLNGFEGLCALYAGDARGAHDRLDRSLTTLNRPRDAVQRGIVSTDLALARLRLGDPAACVDLMHKAVDITATTGGRVAAQRIRLARRHLQPWRAENFMTELDDHIHDTLVGR